MQVLLFAVLVHTTHTALEDAEEALNRVSSYVAASAFLASVQHGFVAEKFLVSPVAGKE